MSNLDILFSVLLLYWIYCQPFSYGTRKQAASRARAMDPGQGKTDCLNLIESSFRLLEKARQAALSATNSTEVSVKSNCSSESVGGTGNVRAKPLVVGYLMLSFFCICCCSLYVACVFYVWSYFLDRLLDYARI